MEVNFGRVLTVLLTGEGDLLSEGVGVCDNGLIVEKRAKGGIGECAWDGLGERRSALSR